MPDDTKAELEALRQIAVTYRQIIVLEMLEGVIKSAQQGVDVRPVLGCFNAIVRLQVSNGSLDQATIEMQEMMLKTLHSISEIR